MKDTTILIIQICLMTLGVTLMCLGAFVFMNKAEMQYVLPFTIAGVVIAIGPTMMLPLIVEREFSTKC